MTGITIEIGLPRTIEWEILEGDIPPPPDGTVITLRPVPGVGVTPPPTGVMGQGKLVAGGWPFELGATAEALGPFGAVAKLYCAPEVLVGTPTKLALSRTLAVTLLRPNGAPMAQGGSRRRRNERDRAHPRHEVTGGGLGGGERGSGSAVPSP